MHSIYRVIEFHPGVISAHSYDIFAINIASTMLDYIYGDKNTLTLNDRQDLCLKIATPVGILIGQLFFGWLADVVGRKKMCGSNPLRAYTF